MRNDDIFNGLDETMNTISFKASANTMSRVQLQHIKRCQITINGVFSNRLVECMVHWTRPTVFESMVANQNHCFNPLGNDFLCIPIAPENQTPFTISDWRNMVRKTKNLNDFKRTVRWSLLAIARNSQTLAFCELKR